MAKQRLNQAMRVVDIAGNTVDFIITAGETSEQDISGGYVPDDAFGREGFYICPTGTGTINVRLVGQSPGESFAIPAARVTAMQGMWMEEKCVEILATGTTVTAALIGWAK